MASAAQVRGMLLEEALLYLLTASGYRTIVNVQDDPTLTVNSSGLAVKGRGSQHQIDAIADFRVLHPFSHPQRLLVEAKCFKNQTPVKIEVPRNAVGVLKDVSEFWVTGGSNNIANKRYHYQYALFSATGYTADTQSYAFAQDIYLISLAQSKFIQPIVESIRNFTDDAVKEIFHNTRGLRLQDLRTIVRARLQPDYSQDPSSVYIGRSEVFYLSENPLLNSFISTCRRLDGAILATLGGRFPVFLTPNPEIDLRDLPDTERVRIRWDEDSWYIVSSRDPMPDRRDRRIFSFDLPTELFVLYAEGGELSLDRALDLKAENLNEIQAILTGQNSIRVLTMQLDTSWLDQVRQHLRSTIRTQTQNYG